MTLVAYGTIGLLLAATVFAAHRRGDVRHADAVHEGWQQLQPLLLRLPPALIAGVFLASLVPEEQVVAVLGEASGARGILLATLIGSIMPGGPMIVFPLALALIEVGIGLAQMITLITAWSVLALHRVIVFEAPMMGWRFVAVRLLASLPVPLAAGFLTEAVLAATR
ncbi:hypothetical protein [Aquisalimonas sp.]|uniref:hypothetical protein n=1 Tax=Aquisalimonas sp. TaxID=1872621 RepID=UPI0025BB8BAD|nr:hypothetical protein [Aquisalimonas sp.]